MRVEEMGRARGGCVLVVVAAMALAGCYKADVPRCTVSCASSADCPGDLGCSAENLCSPGGSSCSGMPDADLSQPQALTVTVTGSGTVVSDPPGIDCPGTCTAEFTALTPVTLTATPAATTVMESWAGDCTGGAPCTVVMDGAKTVTAKFAAHGSPRWVKQVSFDGQDYGDAEIDVDAQGNVIAVGAIEDAGINGMYIVKYAQADGAKLWERNISPGTGFGFNVDGIDTDAAGNAYVCARMQGGGTTTIGTSTVSGDIFGNVVVVRINGATGAIEWAKSWGGTAQDECGGIAVSGTDLFVAGKTSSMPATFDGQSLVGATGNGFLVRASIATGTAAAAVLIPGNNQIHDIAVNGSNIAVVGSFSTAATINTCSLSLTQTGTDGMILNFSSNLVCIWANHFGSNNAGQNTVTNAIAPVPGGGWVATGSFEGPVLFASSGTSLQSAGMRDVFIARYDLNGAHKWSFGYGGTGNDGGYGVDVTPTGEVVFGGMFDTAITFGPTTLTGTNDAFVTRMSAGLTPVHQWAVDFGAAAYDNFRDVGVDAQGTVNVVVDWTGMTDVAGMPLTAVDYDGWVGSFVR